MSKENVNPGQIGPELSELESALGALCPAETVNREELLFEAGRRAAQRHGRYETRVWKSLAAALAVMLAGQTFLFGPVVDESGGGPVAGRDGDEKSVDESGTDDDSKIRSMIPEEIPAESMANRSHRPSPGGAQYLQLRRLALSEGVDAVDLLPSDKEKTPAESGATRREILRELLGS